MLKGSIKRLAIACTLVQGKGDRAGVSMAEETQNLFDGAPQSIPFGQLFLRDAVLAPLMTSDRRGREY